MTPNMSTTSSSWTFLDPQFILLKIELFLVCFEDFEVFDDLEDLILFLVVVLAILLTCLFYMSKHKHNTLVL